MRNPNKILVVIQRSNGDVLLSSSLIKSLFENFGQPQIDLLVNEDTLEVAKIIPFTNHIHTFSYKKKRQSKWKQEKKIFVSLYNKYDLSINLTASDRSVIYALLASKNSISALENDLKKCWWKKIFLTHHYIFDDTKHILINNLNSLKCLNINIDNTHYPIEASRNASSSIEKKLQKLKIHDFIIFHPSAQYHYKIYPRHLRNVLLEGLSKLGIPILITGSKNIIDMEIKKQLPILHNVIDFIGETSLEELIALSKLSLCYIGMDTLNMHIAASQNKRIFTIFGPTNLKMWSPWSNVLKIAASKDKPLQTYGNITIFQASLPCVACGKAGCNNKQGRSECLHIIDPKKILHEVNSWYENA
ncbi:glycosyltransferase family 9 protein [Candidatus Thioglobus sp.]|nr:glycosyltransferase family 9 protein [Candidatus Thioglobus sp.]